MSLLNSEENQVDLHLSFYLSHHCSHLIYIPRRRVNFDVWGKEGLIIVGGEWKMFRYGEDLAA